MNDFERAARDFLWGLFEQRHDDEFDKKWFCDCIVEFLEQWPERTEKVTSDD